MASSFSTIPVSPPPQPNAGEGLETPLVVPTASTEVMVDAPVAPSAVPGEATSVAPSSVSGDAEDLREGFIFPLIDPCSRWIKLGSQILMKSLKLLIQKGDIQAVPINFDFLCAASKDWSHWVDREILDSDFWDSLLDAGVHWSILISRSYNMFRDTESLPVCGGGGDCSSFEEAIIHQTEWLAFTLYPPQGGFSPPCCFCAILALISIGHCFPLAPLFLGHLYSQLDLLHDCEVEGDSCYILSAAFNTSALQTFFWEHSVSYLFTVKDKSAAWGRFSDLPREFLDCFPDFRNNLPLVYRWVGLKTRDYDLVDTLDHEENVDDYRSLSYLSTVNPGFLPILSAAGVSFIPYCAQRVQRQFGLDQGIPVGPQETATCVADLTAFIKSRAFARWGGETNRVMIPGGHRLGFNTPSMGAYWQRFTQSMVEFVIVGRSDKTPMSVHRKPLVSNPYLTPPSQFAISYANNQKLGFTEWDGVRGGWIAYTIHLPESWRNSVNVVEDRLIMPSKRGKGSKRDAPMDLAVEKTSKKPTPSIPSSKKAPSKMTKAGKKGKSPTLVSSAAKESTTAPVEEPAESTVAPSKPKSVSASPSKKSGKKSVASRPSKGQKKTNVSSSSPDEEQPSTVSTPSLSKKKKFVAPLFSLGAAGRTRSRSGSKITHGSGRSGGGVVVVETAAMGQDEDLRKSAADSSEVGAESTGEDHSSSSDSFFDSTPGSVPEEQIMSAGSTADDDDMPGADDSSMGPANPMEGDLAIVPHAGHGRSDVSMAYIMEGISLFGTTPSFRAIPAGDFVISASRIVGETPPIVGGAFIPEETHAQGPVESESVVDLGVSTADHDALVEDAGVSAADTLAGSEHLENIGMDDTVRMSEDASEVVITGEITAVSPPPRPTAEAGSSVGASGLSSEVADFLKEFDRKAPNPHPEQFFWRFNGPLVPFGSFWVPNDCSPYLLRLSAGRSDFTADFKLSTGLGGPMLSLLGSVLAAMSESSLEDVTKTQILAWRRFQDEVEALKNQIALLQDSLAALTAYQNEMVSTGRMILGTERGGSFLDSLLD
uniref:Aminotransferase-like plant mobile domain-containing protein n=1 Tax=Fagus sylvatica TaxID=28930 RepID=A0A2N9GQP8_FAGSY